jgi:hypothetical protein
VIHILFVPGTFGSTVQYTIRQFDKNLIDNRILCLQDELILPDGSMHSFVKTGHYTLLQDLNDFLDGKTDRDIIITSPIYPMVDAHAESIIALFVDRRPNDKFIFIYVADIEQAEITILAHYHKISTGFKNLSIGTLCGDNQHDIINWNPKYTHWSQMRQWELREWFSKFYPVWVQEWIEAKNYVPPSWLTISSGDILNNTNETFKKIINKTGNFNSDFQDDFDDFVDLWRSKQQYILDEHATIKNIVKFTVDNIPYTWEKLNVISEAIIQRRLRDAGYEIKCYNLNEFPTNSLDLYNLLEPI